MSHIGQSFVEPHADLLENQNRVLLKEGCVMRPARFKNVNRYCLLFNDVIVFAKPTRDGNKLKLKQVLDLRKVLLNNQVTVETSLQNPFCVRTREREYLIGTESAKEQEIWQNTLAQAVMKLRQIDSPFDDPIDTAIIQLRDLVRKSDNSTEMLAVVRLLEDSKQKQTEKYHYEQKVKERMKQSMASLNEDVAAWLQQEFMMSSPPVKKFDVAVEKEQKEEAPAKEAILDGRCVQEIERHLFSFDVRNLLKGADSWDFDIFELDRLTNGHPLSVLTMHYFEILNLFETFKVSKEVLARFILEIETGYLANPYHNRIHGADVMQNAYCLLHAPSLITNFEKQDVMNMVIAAGIHDFKHPGTNNVFQVATSTPVAIRYNDISVLENMHVAEAFAIMARKGFNVFEGMEEKDRRASRQSIIDMVLATDMKQHFSNHHKFEEAVKAHKEANPQALWFQPTTPEEKAMALQTTLHCADLGNPAKPHTLMRKWTDLVCQEFFEQGDKERALGMPISMNMDREKANIPGSQIGFINFIIDPLYKSFQKMVPESSAQLVNIADNKKFWEGQQQPKKE